jgi:hypothetical protein
MTTNPQNGSPSTPIGFLNYLNHFYLDGSAVLQPGTDVPNDYFFPGNSDSLRLGTNGIDVPLWNESTAGNAPGDRRMLAVCGPFTFEPQARHTIDGAFVFAANEAGGKSLENILDDRLREAKLFYNENLITCVVDYLSASVDNVEATSFNLYPNPASSHAFINSQNAGTWMLYNQMGKLVDQSTSSQKSHEIDLHLLPAGVYVLRYTTSTGSACQKIIVEQ